MINIEMNTMVYKTLNGLAPEYLSDLFIRNSKSHLRALPNTSTDLKLPKKASKIGKKCFSLEVYNHGMPF